MIVELHMIQNFAPSNLNRDDTGAPKDCTFGDKRRSRISSQCFKRSMRTHFKDNMNLPAERFAVRTRQLLGETVGRLVADGKPVEEATAVVRAALGGLFGVDEDGSTPYLVFVGRNEIAALVSVCNEYWSKLLAAGLELDPKATAKKTKEKAQEALKKDKSLIDAVKGALTGGKAIDMALFGRFIADLPDKDVSGAAQVAHAISTHASAPDFDYYTAVDDLKGSGTGASGMIGTVQFNSSCFYRYLNVDVAQLSANMGGDKLQVADVVEAYLRAAIEALPTGKQNSMAAHNLPSLVYAVVRDAGTSNLANAFVNPVRAGRDGDLVQNSIRALDGYWARLTKMYGGTFRVLAAATTEDGSLKALAPHEVDSVADILTMVRLAVTEGDC